MRLYAVSFFSVILREILYKVMCRKTVTNAYKIKKEKGK